MSIAVDGRMELAATGNDNGEVKLWSLDSSTSPWSFTGDDASSALSVSLSPDGRLLAAGFRNGTMALWDVSQPAGPVAIELESEPFGSWTTSVGFSPTGSRFVAASSDGHARFWNVDGWEPLGTELLHPNGVTNTRFVDDQTVIIALADGSVRTWNLDHQHMTSLLAPIWSAKFGPAGDTLLAMSRERGVLWSVSDGGQLRPRHGDLVSPDPSYTFTGEAALAPDGLTIIAGTFEGSVLLTRPADDGSLELVRALDSLGSLIEAVELSPDGTTLVALANRGRVGLWQLDGPSTAAPSTAEPSATIDLAPNTVAFNVAIDPGGSLLAVTTSDGMLSLYDIEDPTRVEELAAVPVGDDSASGVSFHPVQPIVAVGNHDTTVSLWDYSTVTDPVLLARISGPNGRIHDVDFDSGGTRLAASTSDGMAWMWDVTHPSAPVLLARLASEGQMYTLTFSPDGNLLVGAGANQLVTVWKTDPDTAISELCRHVGDPVTSAEWNDLAPGVPYRPPCRAGL
jgi:WD40 repeat protein